jgi:Zn-finger nucleic acid-binding protein
MNFIGELKGHEIQVELKYCERCGGLWLRLQGASGVYCVGCDLRLAARPDPGEAPPRKPRRRKARPQGMDAEREQDLQHQTRIECLQGVAVMEVRL